MAPRQLAGRPRRANSPAAANTPASSATRSARGTTVNGLYALGALLLGGEAAVHVQQFVVIFDPVRWVGPLFVANAVACAAAIAGLAYKPTRALAGLAGVLISAAALGGLGLSYTVGLFGWIESGLRTPVAIAIAAEVGAVIVLGAATRARMRAAVR